MIYGTVRRLALALAASAFLGFAVGGCRAPSFDNKLATRQEVQIGAESAAELEAQYPPVTDPAIVGRVSAVAARIVPEAMKVRGDITYRVKVLPNDDVNAFSLPGGWIYVTTGMMNKIGASDDMLAFVIAHEAAHVALRHGVKVIVDAVGRDDLLDMITEGKYQDLANLTLQLDQASYSREDEYQADRYAVKFMADGGYNPKAALQFFDLMQSSTDAKPDWLQTHPLSKNRIMRAEDDIRDLPAAGKT